MTKDEAYKKGYTEKQLEQLDQGPIDEDFPFLSRRLTGDSEEKINQNEQHNAWIIIGRDRPAGLSSGYGQYPIDTTNRLIDGRKASTIDIGVGRYSCDPTIYTKKEVVGNNMQLDAARIYISQKTDIDSNFEIKQAGTLAESIAQSAIALKADVLRLISRESIKLVANLGDPYNSAGERNRGIDQIYGIQLITGTGDNAIGENVQPITKTGNLVEFLKELISQLNTFIGLFATFVQVQDRFNTAIRDHKHTGIVKSGPNGSLEVDQSFDLLAAHIPYSIQKPQIDTGAKNSKINIGSDLVSRFLEVNADKYIGSKYNKTN